MLDFPKNARPLTALDPAAIAADLSDIYRNHIRPDQQERPKTKPATAAPHDSSGFFKRMNNIPV